MFAAPPALQQLDQLTNGKALPPHGVVLSLVVASLNALLWVAMIVFAFVQVWCCIISHACTAIRRAFPRCFLQASRVTGAGLGLKRSGVIIRSRPLQYLTFQQSDLDSFVLYTQAVKLRVG